MSLALGLLLTSNGFLGCEAQFAPPSAPMPFMAEQDHQNMMDQLGIKRCGRGPSGREGAESR